MLLIFRKRTYSSTDSGVAIAFRLSANSNWRFVLVKFRFLIILCVIIHRKFLVIFFLLVLSILFEISLLQVAG
jgi:hypothetical protein